MRVILVFGSPAASARSRSVMAPAAPIHVWKKERRFIWRPSYQTPCATLSPMDRRTFLISGLAAARRAAAADPLPLETFRQWSEASPQSRELSLQLLVDRIRERDQSIQAWVQVSPQPATGSGKLSGI